MTHDQLGKVGPDQGFGLGFGIEGIKSPSVGIGNTGCVQLGRIFLYRVLDRSERADDCRLYGAAASYWRLDAGPAGASNWPIRLSTTESLDLARLRATQKREVPLDVHLGMTMT